MEEVTEGPSSKSMRQLPILTLMELGAARQELASSHIIEKKKGEYAVIPQELTLQAL